jgi:hypothetical protein
VRRRRPADGQAEEDQARHRQPAGVDGHAVGAQAADGEQLQGHEPQRRPGRQRRQHGQQRPGPPLAARRVHRPADRQRRSKYGQIQRQGQAADRQVEPLGPSAVEHLSAAGVGSAAGRAGLRECHEEHVRRDGRGDQRHETHRPEPAAAGRVVLGARGRRRRGVRERGR